MPRILRIAVSLATVLVVYGCYALVAVPLIEPEADHHRRDRLSEAERKQWEQGANQRWQRELEGLFAPGSWELENPIILESDQVKLLLRDYDKSPDGKEVFLPRCTIILTPEGPAANEAQRRRESVVLRASEGALLVFDEPFDLSQGEIGRLQSGQLKGTITIHSDRKSPGPEDDLNAVTRDVSLNRQRIWTPHAVEFRLGRSSGRGRWLWIKLADEQKQQAKQGGLDFGGIQWIELRHLERLTLQPDSESSPSAARTPALPGPLAETSALDASLPIEVTCRGRSRFDPVGQVATFQDRVDVRQNHPDGPSDQLNCETLKVYFARPRSTVAAGTNGQPKEPPSRHSLAWQLRPRRIEARGNPVTLHAPSRQIEVRGEWLEYDFQSGRVFLDGSRDVFLRKGDREIHARSLRYQPDGDGGLGQVVATGPGWVRGQIGDQARQPFYARWNELLHLRPFEGQPTVSLYGGAELEFGEMGRLTAEQIHLYLDQSTPEGADGTGRLRLRPDRMVALGERQTGVDESGATGLSPVLGGGLAQPPPATRPIDGPAGRVQLHSPQLSVTVNKWHVWFVQRQPEQAAAHADPRGVADATRAEQRSRLARAEPRQGYAASAPSGFAVPGVTGQTPGSPGQQHYEIVADSLRSQVVIQDGKAELSDLTIEGNVRVTETRTARPGQPPVEITGELIDVEDADQPHTKITVTGTPQRPAHFEGRGLGVTSSNINVNRGENRLWINGPGWMDLPLDRDLQGRLLGTPGDLRIDWQEAMTFDGRTVHFEGMVAAQLRHPSLEANLETDAMDVGLLQPIRFTDEAKQPQPQVETIACRGNVLLEHYAFDDSGQPASVDRMQLGNRMQLGKLDMNLISGETTGSGPGQMTTVRRGSSRLLPASVGGRPRDDSDAQTDSEATRLTHLNIQFQGPLWGNLHDRELTFCDEIQAIYAPVDSWEATLTPDDLDQPGSRRVLLQCDRLKVAEMPVPLPRRRAVEFEAEGNVSVEGNGFMARAPRMTYTEAKELLILEGKGWTDAVLYLQDRPGARYSRMPARKVSYWISTGQFQLEGPRSLTLNHIPGQ